MTERGDWVGYYDEQAEREPRDVLMQALAMFEDEGRRGLAVDLGCGQGFETAELLRRGWEVVAIDATEEGIRRLRRRIPEERCLPPPDRGLPDAGRGHPVRGSRLRELQPAVLPRLDVFPRLWGDLRAAIRPDGRFAGELFGDRDTWAATERDMTFLDVAAARELFDGMELESFEEEESDDEGWGDEMKHWHVFHAIARRLR